LTFQGFYKLYCIVIECKKTQLHLIMNHFALSVALTYLHDNMVKRQLELTAILLISKDVLIKIIGSINDSDIV